MKEDEMTSKDEPTEPSEANVAVWADALHKQHVAEFAWMAGDALHEPMTVEQCGNCQRWGRYAAAVWENVLPTAADQTTDQPDDGPVEWVLTAWARETVEVTGDSSDVMTQGALLRSLTSWLYLAEQEREVAGISKTALRKRAVSTVVAMYEDGSTVRWDSHRKALAGVREAGVTV